MAFTNPWSNIIPAGSDPANTADDEIRQVRLDVFERMNQIVPDWTADPIVALTSIRKTRHWSDGNFDPLGSDTLTEGYAVTGLGVHSAAVGTNLIWRLPLQLPVGATLQSLISRVFKDNVAGLLGISVVEADDLTPSETSLASTTVGPITGWQTITQAALGLVVAQDKPLIARYSLNSAAAGNNVRLFQCHYEYDIPAALTGITG